MADPKKIRKPAKTPKPGPATPIAGRPDANAPPDEASESGEDGDAAPRGLPFPVVGIGASAGGLTAFEALFSAMPSEDTGMAYVLVQHLAPDHKSLLSDLVQRYTRMRVFEAADGMPVQPNCTYIIPPKHDLTPSPMKAESASGCPETSAVWPRCRPIRDGRFLWCTTVLPP